MVYRKSYTNEDISGQQFGRLTAIEKVEGSRSKWSFKCECGNIIELSISRVFGGQLSCGCLREECAIDFVKSHITHHKSRSKLYRIYRGMISRCYNPNNSNYKRYGARNITVCEEWLNSFESFEEWANSHGYNPNVCGFKEQSIERIDNSKGYCPENCKWATAYEQIRNRDCTKLYEYNNIMYSASEFADKYGITDKSFVYRRLEKKQPLGFILDEWNKIHNIPDYLMEVSEYASNNHISEGHTRRLLNQGLIKGEKIGRKWYVYKPHCIKE